MPERRSHDYARHGVTSLFAAFNIADGTVISQTHRQHRAVEFKKFLIAIDIMLNCVVNCQCGCIQVDHVSEDAWAYLAAHRGGCAGTVTDASGSYPWLFSLRRRRCAPPPRTRDGDAPCRSADAAPWGSG
ncbi:MAG TPA: hypothetical protein VGO30_15505, partial [Mycobacterium sp.]|nr:hypothetical protein [Mycobacterium sp.]